MLSFICKPNLFLGLYPHFRRNMVAHVYLKACKGTDLEIIAAYWLI